MEITDSLKEKYAGKTVVLYPGDTYYKKAIIVDLDEFGWTFKFIEGTNPSSGYHVGETAFFTHSHDIYFKFID